MVFELITNYSQPSPLPLPSLTIDGERMFNFNLAKVASAHISIILGRLICGEGAKKDYNGSRCGWSAGGEGADMSRGQDGHRSCGR